MVFFVVLSVIFCYYIITNNLGEEYMSVNFDLFKKLVGDKLFTVKFVKKTTGSTVTRNYKVDKKSEQVYEGKNYLTVYDIQKEDYRTLVLDNIVEMEIDNKVLKYDELLELDEKSVNDITKKSESLPSFKVDESIGTKISKALGKWNQKSIYGTSI